MKYVVSHEDNEWDVEVHEMEDGSFEVEYDGKTFPADFQRANGSSIDSLLVNKHSYELLMEDHEGVVTVIHHGRGIDLNVESERERNARLIAGDVASTDGEAVTAVMPGIVVAVNVKVGDIVAPNDSVCVLEAMKMENEIKTTTSGIVRQVAVAAGETVNPGDLLIDIGPLEETESE
ncbi:MAG: biotin carboxyl carrier protein [Planctomycetota bacterium]|jgi:biotin carboxyl carrier protein